MKEELTRAARSLNCKCTGRRAAQVWPAQDNPHEYNQRQLKPAEPTEGSGPWAVSTQHGFFHSQ